MEKEMSTLSSIPAWRIPWTEAPGGLQSMGLRRVWPQLKRLSTCTHTNITPASPFPYLLSLGSPTNYFLSLLHTYSPSKQKSYVIYFFFSPNSLIITLLFLVTAIFLIY